MKRFLSATGLAAMLFLAACSEDFTVSAPYKDITVVYGILNAADSAHYIRIQKGFMDENKSAIQISKEPDSSYYKSINVTMLEYTPNAVNVLSLNRVDLDAEGADYSKNQPYNDHQFFTTPHLAYKLKHRLKHFYLHT